ncbi:helix-turn-helix transcriptional regulator [Leifsonia sp. ZF2019]|uniref:helix-turn-helix domain-containing protein n=1 Tax=Leifsonia sp. ZF2019 TaxID=2781978 RepID=UPI001CC096F5|nr:helix-turn-helix transcriptional regulator [Leifsonia sp. ZF2019]UAJ78357.1 helix-turn-helix transcriptional regulator [Leifsonia sp. ZF2019]
MSAKSWLFGERLQTIRREKKMSGEDLAKRSGITRSTITNLETGRRNDITVSELVAFAQALEVQPAYIDPRVDPDRWQKIQAALAAVEHAQAALSEAVTS